MEQILQEIKEALARIEAAMSGTTSVTGFGYPGAPDSAFNRDVLGVGQVIVDGTTVNPDGSVWDRDPRTGQPYQIMFGYISPKKTPEVFGWAKMALDPSVYETWFSNWTAHPYAIYKADVRGTINSGQMNFVMFNYLLGQPVREHQQ